MKKVSFVLAVKDGEYFLENTINSILNQNYQNLEVIVVDDHSSDRTPEILKTMVGSHPNLITLKSPENKSGVAAARNLGTRVASGEIIFPVDADDPNFPNRAEVSVAELEKNKADIFYANLERFYPETGERTLRHFQPYDPVMLKYINYIAHAGSSAYYKYVFDKLGGYDENIKIGEDWDLWLRAQSAGFKFCCKNIALSQFTMHKAQTTNSSDRGKIKNRIYWNKVVREKNKIFDVDPEYVKNNAEPAVKEFYFDKNHEIWFSEDSIPKN